jgi:uncharacterized protein (DUF433 family)
MSHAAVEYRHLSVDTEGLARVEGTRYTVLHLAGEHYHYGWSAEEILRQHPDLRPEQVYAALAYFYDHHEAMTAQMAAIAEHARKESAGQPLSRAELLKRRASRGA